MSSVGTFSFPSFMAKRTAREKGAMSPTPLPPKTPLLPPPQKPAPRSPWRHRQSLPQCTGPESIHRRALSPHGNAEWVVYPQIQVGGGAGGMPQIGGEAKRPIAPQTSSAATLQERVLSPPQK